MSDEEENINAEEQVDDADAVEQATAKEEPKIEKQTEAPLRPSLDSYRKKRDKNNLHDDGEAFIVSFTSLSIILLAFFIFLNSLATPDQNRERKVIGSLAKHFKPLNKQTGKKNPNEISGIDLPIPELATDFPKLTFATRYNEVADAAEENEFTVIRGSDSFFITLPSEELFRSGEAQIKSSILPKLTKIASILKKLELYMEIEGHTDSQPMNSVRYPSNWELSIARSVSVLRFFLDQGVPKENLSASGRSQFTPIADNSTPEGRAKNRRVMLIIREESI